VIVSRRGNNVDWIIDGVRVALLSSASFTSSNVFVGFWDGFASLSDNNTLSFGLVDNVRVEVPATAPTISAQPQSLAIKVTSNATFTVSAAGLPSPTYQWQFNGTNLAGATTATYTVTNAQYADAGNYSVILSNLAGVLPSANASLTILPAAAAQFQSAAVQLDNSLQLVLGGDAGATYYVESSTNLVDWSALTNVTLTSGTFTFNAGWVTNDVQRYFRARSGP
jgi:hypothetical protein